jgi:HAD superfamily phosphoserine phosphatase-like hydrolase
MKDRWAFFDVDRTVLRCDSFLRVVSVALRDAPWRLPLLVLVSPLLATYPLGIDPRWTKSALLWAITVGHTPRAALRLLRECGVRATRGAFRPAAGRAIASVRAAGHRVCYVSASPGVWLRPVLSRFDPGEKRVVATRLRAFLGGVVIAGRDCRGEEKVRRVEALLGRDLEWSEAYGDDRSDVPLLSRARRRVVVNPGPGHIDHFRQAFGSSFEVVSWK